jgi:hypothetical protein
MDILKPDQMTIRKMITRRDVSNLQMSIEKAWLLEQGYKIDDDIPVFLHVPTDAIILLPRDMARKMIKAKKKNSTKIEKGLASA